MNSLVVLVALVGSLVHAAPSGWAGVPWAVPGAWAHPLAAHVPGPVWGGPINIPVVLPSGHLADTPEVSALKAAHATAVVNTPGAHGALPLAGIPLAGVPHAAAWHGGINIPVVLPSGHLADTPEVAALKAAHIARLHGALH